MDVGIEALMGICPRTPERVLAEFVVPLNAAMDEFEINTGTRQAAFIAQIAHESAGFIHTRELWGPTPVQERYEGRADLGNTEPGDGSRYRGRGLIQITGRANYATCGNALDADLVGQPELLEQPELACRSAAWFWNIKDLNRLADAGDFERITKRINGGLNGQADRLAIWARAQDVLA